jgi:hypothetical protein
MADTATAGILLVVRLWRLRASGRVVCCRSMESVELQAAMGTTTEISSAELTTSADNRVPRPSIASMLLWLGLAASSSAMLLATTNQLCIDVATVPFLWVLPLASI